MAKRLRQHGRGGYDATRGAIQRAILAHEDFTAAALSGERVTHWTSGAGRAEGLTRQAFCDDERRGLVDYVVRSYATPIAWHSRAGIWVVPGDTYSPTTARHQSIVRTALAHEPQCEPTLSDSYEAQS